MLAKATAVGKCGELVWGELPDGTRFQVTCPVALSASVLVEVFASEGTRVTCHPQNQQVSKALLSAAQMLEVTPTRILAEFSNKSPVSSDFGYQEAEIVAAGRALAAACECQASEEDIAVMARTVMRQPALNAYKKPAAVDIDSGELIRDWDWRPSLAIAAVIPQAPITQKPYDSTARQKRSGEYAEIIAQMDQAVTKRDTRAFVDAAAWSCQINQDLYPHPYFKKVSALADKLDALGVCMAHHGSVIGIVFDAFDSGRAQAGQAKMQLRRKFKKDETIILATPLPAKAVQLLSQ